MTFEIIRRRLAAINEEAALTVMRVSGSQVVTDAGDLNSAIMNAAGEVVLSSMYMLVQSCALSSVVGFILDNFEENPGIGPGDMFLTNDPFVSGRHQADAVLVAPIYDGDSLIAWCGTTVHEPDVGGPVPGSIAVGARSIFEEPIPMTPVRIVEGGQIRRDIEHEWLIRSRARELVALDFLGQVAANRLINDRLLELCRRYGTPTVVGTLSGLLDTTEIRLRERLAEIPDGVWRHTGFVEHDGINDDVYAVRLTLTKQGERLDLDFTESSDQAPGLINSTQGNCRSFALATLMPLLGYHGVPWVPAAFERVATLRTRPGSITHAVWPAGVSLGGTSTGHEVRSCLTVCLAEMLGAAGAHGEQVMACCMTSAPGITISGRHRDGRRFTSMLLDAQVGGGGGRSFADGVDAYGLMHSPGGSCSNIEVNERDFPILYLWRDERIDSGGPGSNRGGVGGTHAFVVHEADGPLGCTVWGHGVEQPNSSGVFGAEPGSPNGFLVLRGAAGDARAAMRRSEPATFPGHHEVPAPKQRLQLGVDDVLVSWGAGGGGVGDPLERPPERVAADVAEGLVSRAGAARDYGVVVDGGSVPAVDWAATVALRAGRRAERLDSPEGERVETVIGGSGDVVRPGVVRAEGGPRCRRCGAGLGGSDGTVIEDDAAGYRWPLSDEQPGSRRFVVRHERCGRCGSQFHTFVVLLESAAGK